MSNKISDNMMKYLESLASVRMETEEANSQLVDSEKYQLGIADGEILLARRILESIKN